MGNFNLEVKAVGGHGCDRTTKEGGSLKLPYHGRNCPDCLFALFVEELKRNGCSISSATITHWPGENGQVVDDINTMKRESGQFA